MTSVFSWLGPWRPEQLRGTLMAIFVSEAAGAPMRSVPYARAVAGAGLEDDRYAKGLGHWIRTDACELTLASEEELCQAEHRSRLTLRDGAHRRNLVVRGLSLAACRRRHVRIGEVLTEFHRLRPPCGYLDRVTGPGTAKALGKAGGIGLRIIEGGVLRVGDEVRVIDAGNGSE